MFHSEKTIGIVSNKQSTAVKILSEINANINGEKDEIKVQSIVFPAEVVENSDVDYDKHNQYLKKLLAGLRI